MKKTQYEWDLAKFQKKHFKKVFHFSFEGLRILWHLQGLQIAELEEIIFGDGLNFVSVEFQHF